MIIGITGRRGSGKDTLGNFLVGKYGFKRLAFADAVKEFAYKIGWDGQKDEKGRALLQAIGEGMREVNENIWIDALARKVYDDLRSHYVITDVRYPNEAGWIESWPNGLIVKVVRDIDRTSATDAHVSETSVDEIGAKVMIQNDSTIEKFLESAEKELLCHFFNPRAKKTWVS